MKIRRIFLSAAALLLSGVMVAQNYGWHPDDENYAESCTSIMVGKKASTDGSVMTAHSCDSNYRTWLTMEESKTYADGKQPIYWGMLHTEEHDDLRNLEVKGYIPAPATPTYRFLNVAYPCMNEKQLAIGETLEGATEVKASDKPENLDGAFTGIIIQAAKQPWTLGTKSADMVNFDVAFAPITVNGVETVWGNKESLAPAEDGTGLVNNGETIADMEYFYMKERADQYGNMGWPNVVHTEYLVDPKKTYNTIDIHYAYVGSNEAIQKSEKDITIVVESSVANVKTNLITPLTTATKVTAKFTTAANTDVK